MSGPSRTPAPRRRLATLSAASMIAAAALVALAPGAARAADERPIVGALSGGAARGCLRASALAERIGRWLGRTTIDARLTITVDAAAQDETRVAFVVRRGDEIVAVRRWEDLRAPCEERLDAVSLSMALAIDSTLLERLGGRAPSAPPPRARDRVAVTGGAVALWGVLPAGTVGLRGAVDARVIGPLRLGLGALAITARDATLGPGHARLGLLAAEAEGCLVHDGGRVLPALCAGFVAGRLGAEGRGFDNSFEDALFWSAASARIDLRVRIGGALALAASAGFSGLLGRKSLEVLDADGVVIATRSLPRLGASVGLGLAAYFY